LGAGKAIVHGMIFVFLAFAGFESSAPLAEETRTPRRTVPRAIVLSALLIGLFFTFCAYAVVVGWGFPNLATYLTDPNPWQTLAGRVWGAKGRSTVVPPHT